MDEFIGRLYYILENPLVTPANLIVNVKLPNYRSLMFQKEGRGLVAVMECSVDGEMVEFRYYFDEHDRLNRAICVDQESDAQQVLFDRDKEAQAMQKRIIHDTDSEPTVVAI